MVEKLNELSAKVALLIGLGLAAAYFSSAGSGIAAKDRVINQLNQDIAKQNQEVASAKSVVANKEKFQNELNYVSDRLKAALEYLPTTLNAQELLRQLYQEASNSGVKLVSVKPGNNLKEKFYEQISLEVELEGSYSQLTLFLSYVSKLKRIIRIKSFDLKTKEFLDGKPVLGLKGQLVAYRYVEPKEGEAASANPKPGAGQ